MSIYDRSGHRGANVNPNMAQARINTQATTDWNQLEAENRIANKPVYKNGMGNGREILSIFEDDLFLVPKDNLVRSGNMMSDTDLNGVASLNYLDMQIHGVNNKVEMMKKIFGEDDEKAMIEAINSLFVFGGVTVTNAAYAEGQDTYDDITVQVGGSREIINNGLDTFQPGDYIAWTAPKFDKNGRAKINPLQGRSDSRVPFIVERFSLDIEQDNAMQAIFNSLKGQELEDGDKVEIKVDDLRKVAKRELTRRRVFAQALNGAHPGQPLHFKFVSIV